MFVYVDLFFIQVVLAGRFVFVFVFISLSVIYVAAVYKLPDLLKLFVVTPQTFKEVSSFDQ